MPQAAFVLKKYTGVSAGTVSVVGNNLLAYLSTDQNTIDVNAYPIAAPRLSGVFNYSYENWLRLYCTTAPVSQCVNFRLYGPNIKPDDPLNKLIVFMNSTVGAQTPVQVVSPVCRFQQDTNYYDYNNSLSIGTPQTGDKITSVGEFTDYIVSQLKVLQGAASGVVNLQTYTITYDES